jgi:hypothetical protein
MIDPDLIELGAAIDELRASVEQNLKAQQQVLERIDGIDEVLVAFNQRLIAIEARFN